MTDQNPPVQTVLVFPGWDTNPYLTLTYLATAASGRHVELQATVSDLIFALQHCDARSTLLHVHWTSPVCHDATDEADAERLAEDFMRHLKRFRRRGGRLAWTIHNAMPHELLFHDVELRLNRELASQADRVHVMLPQTRDLVAAQYTWDRQREVVIEHPSYQGVYAAREGDRARARARLGIADDERTVLFFGQMRPYKGLDVLLDALEALVARGRPTPTVLLAGATPRGVETHVTQRLPEEVRVIRAHRHIDDSEVGDWFGAADLAVFPYRRILNSGSLHLAATMGVPVAVTGEPHLVEALGDEPWLRFIDRNNMMDSLADILDDPLSYERPIKSLRAFSDRISPWRISNRIEDMIASM